MSITIVLPTYNEAENLPKLVSALLSLPLDLSILVVDDHSPDGTGELAEELSHPDKIQSTPNEEKNLKRSNKPDTTNEND